MTTNTTEYVTLNQGTKASAHFSLSALQTERGKLILERQSDLSSKCSDTFPSPASLIKPNISSYFNDSAATKPESNLSSCIKSTHAYEPNVLPFEDDARTEEGCNLDFPSPNFLS